LHSIPLLTKFHLPTNQNTRTMGETGALDWKNFPKAILFLFLLIWSCVWFLLVRVKTNIISLQKRIFFFMALLAITRILDAGLFRQVCYDGREYEEYCVWFTKLFQCIDIWSIPLTVTVYFILMNFWGEKFYLCYCVQNQKHEEFIKIRNFLYNLFLLAIIMGNMITLIFSVLIFAVPLNSKGLTYRLCRGTFRLLATASVTIMILFFGINTWRFQSYGPGVKRVFILTTFMVVLNSVFPIYNILQIANISAISPYMWILSLVFTVLEFVIYIIVLLFLTPDIFQKKEYIKSTYTTSLDQEEFIQTEDFDDDKSEL
jgi:hypothetical protein